MYPEIHVSADWSHLLSPLHPWLRREILKYGEFAQATYDGFDLNPFPQYGGSCLFGRRRLFEKLGLLRHGYDVTKYLYAMAHVNLPIWLERSLHAEAWSRDSNWMGFVAVSGDEESSRIGCRDIMVAWRGTVVPAEWLEDIQGKLESIETNDHSDIRVEHGFHSIYTSKSETTRYNKLSASEQVMSEIKRLIKFYQDKGEKVSVTITGHSLGGALALLNAYEAASALPSVPVSVISFGAPRVGNEAFGDRLKELGVKVLRMVVKQDVVPKMPGILFNEGIKMVEKVTGTLEWVYTHVGVELGLNVRMSPYLKNCIDLAGFHNLEMYLHLVDGYVSSKSGFRGEAKKDVVLIYKASGILREEIGILPCWHQPANRGLVCTLSKPAKFFLFFLLLNNRLLTHDAMQQRNFFHTPGCVMCLQYPVETAMHLFFQCPVAVAIWDFLSIVTGYNLLNTKDVPLLSYLHSIPTAKVKQPSWVVTFITATWMIWRERNSRILRHSSNPTCVLASKILQETAMCLKYC